MVINPSTTGFAPYPSGSPRPKEHVLDRSYGLELAAAAFLLGALASGLALASEPTTRALGIALGFGLFAAWAVWSERRRWGPTGITSPLVLYGVFWFLYFGLFGLGAFDLSHPVPLSDGQVVTAMSVALGSLILIAIGYRVALLGLQPTIGRFIGDASLPLNTHWAIYVCLAVGWAARIYRFELGLFGYLSIGQEPSGLTYRALQIGDGLLQVGLVLLAIAAWSRLEHPTMSRKIARILLAVNVLPMLVITGLASGVKGQLITDLMPVGIMYLMLRGRLPARALVALLIYLVALYSGVGVFRADLSEGRIRGDEATGLVNTSMAVVERITDSWTKQPLREQVSNFWQGVTGEYGATPANLAIAIDRTPDFVPHTGVARLFTSPFFFVPTRLLGESQINVGQYFATEYLGSTSTTSAFPTQPGDLFIAGGAAAVVVGQLAVGLILGFVWRFLMVQSRTNRSAALYAVIAASFANAGFDFGTLIRSILQMVVAYGIILLFLLRERKVEAERSPKPDVTGAVQLGG